MLSQLRKSRDRSDTASMLTVDEITAEVENRRASTITFEDTDEEDDDGLDSYVRRASVVQAAGLAPQGEDDGEMDDYEDEDGDEDEEDEEEEDEDEEDEPVDEHKAFTSTGGKSSRRRR